MKVIYSTNPKQEATDALAKLFKEYKNIPVLFLSSGGSALALVEPSILSENAELTVSVLDEHYTEDETNRNFCKLQKTAYFLALKKMGATVFDPFGGAVEEAGKRFDTFLKDWRVKYPTGKIVVTVGMGSDGHTAGIVPFSDADSFQKLFFTPDTLAVGYKTGYGPFPERVTATCSLIAKASDVILYAVGREKAEALLTFLDGRRPIHDFPAMFLKTLPSVTLFTDISS
ncbi:MAG: hypothetical protein EXS51_00885 [Candidatus Taylorbacteria bacterium]|nr:hypothetical protein [Candidatus Taylorbacteria bacterium]